MAWTRSRHVLPAADKPKDLDENAKRAAAAGLLTKFFQHYLNGTTGYYGDNPTTVIFTSQVRANPEKNKPGPGAMWARDYAPVGAWAAKHGKLIDILVMPGKKDKEKVAMVRMSEDDVEAEEATQIGKTIRYEVPKGKAGIHEGIAGEFPFSFSENVDKQRLLIITGLRLGIAEEKNGLVTYYDLKSRAPIPELEKRPMDELAAMLGSTYIDLHNFIEVDGCACRWWYSKAAAAVPFNHPSTRTPKEQRSASRALR